MHELDSWCLIMMHHDDDDHDGSWWWSILNLEILFFFCFSKITIIGLSSFFAKPLNTVPLKRPPRVTNVYRKGPSRGKKILPETLPGKKMFHQRPSRGKKMSPQRPSRGKKKSPQGPSWGKKMFPQRPSREKKNSPRDPPGEIKIPQGISLRSFVIG